MGSRQPGALSSTLAALLAGWLATGPAWAVASSSAPTRSEIAVLIVPLGPQSEAAAGQIDVAVRDAIERTERFALVRLVDVLDARNASERETQVEVGEKALAKARAAYNELDTIQAFKESNKAIRAFEQADLSRRMKELTGAWNMKIASLVANGETKAAQLEIQKILAVFPDATFSPNYFPPEEIAFAEKARAAAKKSDGTLEVTTIPSGAEIYVDGSFRGISPTTVKGLAPGDHYVTAKTPGYSLVQQKARPGAVALTLPKAEAWPRYQEVVQEIVKNPWGPGRDAAAMTFGEWVGVDQLFVGIVESAPGASRGQLTFLRLDVKDGHNFAHAQDSVSLGQSLMEDSAELATRMLLTDDPRRGGPVSHFTGPGGSFFTRKNSGYFLLGTGAVLLAGGVFFGLQANLQAETFLGLPQPDPRGAGVSSRGRTYALMADLSFLVGLAAAGTGGFLAFVPAEPADGAAASEAP